MSNPSRPAVGNVRAIARWLLEIKFGWRVVILWFGEREDTSRVPYHHELIEDDDVSLVA